MKPISKTAFYCAAVRMWDAESRQPAIGDRYAKTFLSGDELRLVEGFRKFKNQNGSNVARHRIIDDILRDELAEDHKRRIVMLGAGFDSRAFRMKGGRWLELDEPAVIEHKNARLPIADSPNPLERTPIEFGVDSLEAKLSPHAGERHVTVVLEGVLLYLESALIEATLETLKHAFPRHHLVCDLATDHFVERYGQGIHRRFGELGASFKYLVDNPEALFVRQGYERLAHLSVARHARELKLIQPPMFLLNTILKPLADGYSIYVFGAP